ncbi:MAG: hypothetical protein ACRDYE_11045 [Acidimicrobiales bacterium]
MTGFRHLLAWLLLGGLVVVGAGAAVLGVAQAPNNAPLLKAVTNTLAAPNYSQVLVERASQGRQSEYLVWQAPDRLGGYIQSGNRRSYVYVIGSNQYQSLTVLAGTPTNRLTFYRQTGQGAVNFDPAHGYLPYATQVKNPTQSGSTYSFSVTKQGQTGTFTYTVSGQYVSQFTLSAPGTSIRLDISHVGTSPPVKLPAGAKVVTAPSGSAR